MTSTVYVGCQWFLPTHPQNPIHTPRCLNIFTWTITLLYIYKNNILYSHVLTHVSATEIKTTAKTRQTVWIVKTVCRVVFFLSRQTVKMADTLYSNNCLGEYWEMTELFLTIQYISASYGDDCLLLHVNLLLCHRDRSIISKNPRAVRRYSKMESHLKENKNKYKDTLKIMYTTHQ